MLHGRPERAARRGGGVGRTRPVRQPLLCAGKAQFRLRDGTALVLPTPYLGVPTGAIERVTLPEGCAYVLSVENLTTFNELARGRAGAIDGLVIYTGGMPSPSLLAMYRLIVVALPAPKLLWHWGDIDLGGFRIAAALRAEAQRQGREVGLFNMDPSALVSVPIAVHWAPTRCETFSASHARTTGSRKPEGSRPHHWPMSKKRCLRYCQQELLNDQTGDFLKGSLPS